MRVIVFASNRNASWDCLKSGITAIVIGVLRGTASFANPYLQFISKRVLRKKKEEDKLVEELTLLHESVPRWSRYDRERANWIEHRLACGCIKIISKGHENEGETLYTTRFLPFVVGRTDPVQGDSGKRLILPLPEEKNMYSQVSRRHCSFQVREKR